MQQVLIHWILLKKLIYINVHKLNIDKLKKLPSNLSNLKSEVDYLDVDKLVSVLVDLSKLSD